MRRIDKPVIKTVVVFNDCISIVKDEALKHELEDCVDTLEAAENDFDEKFSSGNFYQLKPNDTVHGGIGKIEMEKVYTNRMVPKGKPGRMYYDKLFMSAPGDKCPLCLQRIVTTLDHYLPKAKFPVFAVTPLNLIPACSDCNKTKLAEIPTSEEEQTLHPYYDNVEDRHWLKAEVIQSNPISFNFYVEDGIYSDLITKRLKKHLEVFQINKLYGTHAAEELQNIKKRLKNLLLSGGDTSVKLHLLECFESGKENYLNSWYTAIYEAMANDVWFCGEGVLNS